MLYYGSYWPVVGDFLVDRGFASGVVFVGMAKGDTSVAQWADPRDLGEYLARRLKALHRIDYVLWHQGEADTSTPATDYAARLQHVVGIVHSNAPGARMLIAQASLCSGGRESPALRGAQAAAVDPARGVFAGPNTDAVRQREDRYDGCHFSERGAGKVAR